LFKRNTPIFLPNKSITSTPGSSPGSNFGLRLLLKNQNPKPDWAQNLIKLNNHPGLKITYISPHKILADPTLIETRIS
jgi:hypothetical protein